MVWRKPRRRPSRGKPTRGRRIKKKQEKDTGKDGPDHGKVAEGQGEQKLIVSDNEIADVVSGWTRIPVRKLAEEESGV